MPDLFARGVTAVALVLTPIAAHAQHPAPSAADRECLARAMYFESAKGADDGMLAVGTVVANRLRSGRYGSNYCGVVGQPGQFAAGVLSRRMDGKAAERARRIAEAVLRGQRHPSARDAMFFHAAGLRFGYGDMHYVLVAGGNAFYEKRKASSAAASRDNASSMARATAAAQTDRMAAASVLTAAVDTVVASAASGPAPALGAGLAYASRPSASGTAPALAAVAALKPASSPPHLRVIAAAAPVEASLVPAPPKPATHSPAIALRIAQAWAAFN